MTALAHWFLFIFSINLLAISFLIIHIIYSKSQDKNCIGLRLKLMFFVYQVPALILKLDFQAQMFFLNFYLTFTLYLLDAFSTFRLMILLATLFHFNNYWLSSLLSVYIHLEFLQFNDQPVMLFNLEALPNFCSLLLFFRVLNILSVIMWEPYL